MAPLLPDPSPSPTGAGEPRPGLPATGRWLRFCHELRMNMNALRQSTRPDRHRLHKGAIRILTAVPLCDGHDSAIMTINLELVRHGIEVIYLGYHRAVADIVR